MRWIVAVMLMSVAMPASAQFLPGPSGRLPLDAYPAPDGCEWRRDSGPAELYCKAEPRRPEPGEADSDALLAQSGLHRVPPPEWYPSGEPADFDENSVRKARAGDPAAMRLVGLYHMMTSKPWDALPWLTKAADAGDRRAMSLLATLYLWGRGVPRDDGKARDWLVRAAQAGDVDAMHWLGELYLSGGKRLARDPAEAARWLRPAAEAGDASAMFRMAQIERDPAGARPWLDRAAAGGLDAAIAELKKRGLPVPARVGPPPLPSPAGPPPECPKLPTGAAPFPMESLKDDLEMQRLVSTVFMSMGDAAAALCWSRRAALNGSSWAAMDLAETYYSYRPITPGNMPRFLITHEMGVAKDDGEALKWLGLAASKNEQFTAEQAMNLLGDLYATGTAVPKDDVEAVRWYRLAVSRGDFLALFPLANMARGGFGMVRDDREAARLLLESGVVGRAYYGAMLADGGPELEKRWTAEALKVAAEHGFVEAMVAHARRLRDGRDGAPNAGEATRWFTLAARLGHPDAASELAAMKA